MATQESDYDFFDSKRNEFVKSHPGEYVVIKNGTVLGFYASQVEAIQSTISVHELGSFIVQRCVSKDEEAARFHSRISFA